METEVLDSPELESADTGDTGLDGEVQEVSDIDLLNDDNEGEQSSSDESRQESGNNDADQDDEAADGRADKPEKEPAKEPAKEQAEEEPEPGVKPLKDAIEADATLKAALAKNPKLQNMLYANARRSAELGQFREVFATLDLAQSARQSAEQLAEVEGEYRPGNFDNLIKRMTDSSAIDGSGTPVTVQQFFAHHRQNYFWPSLLQYAQSSGAEDVQEAAEVIMEFLGDKKGAQTRRAESGDDTTSKLPKDVQERLARLDSLERQQGTQTSQQRQQYEQSAITDTVKSVKDMLTERVKRYAPGLTAEQVAKVTDDTFRDVNAIAGKDKLYQNTWGAKIRAAKTEDDKKALASIALNYAKGVAGQYIQRHVKIFGESAVKQNAETRAKIDAQKKQANVKSTGGNAAPIRQGDVRDMVREAESLSLKHFKRGLKDSEILNVEDHLAFLRKVSKGR